MSFRDRVPIFKNKERSDFFSESKHNSFSRSRSISLEHKEVKCTFEIPKG